MLKYDSSIIIPIYNEEENIALTIKKINDVTKGKCEIICVYDSDNDTTLPILRELILKNSNLFILKNFVHVGPSGALRSGFKKAKGEKILVIMADLCDDFNQIPNLLALVPAKADIVCPSRYCKGGKQLLKPSVKLWL